MNRNLNSVYFHKFVSSILSIISIILGGIVFIAPLSVVFVLPYIPYILGVCFIVLAVTEIYLGYKL